ncbi:hypothetical protein RYB06_15895, partial [Pseudomonas syringae pv. actinidiae]|nr:hypothetical protein [Pseudomonas syringae pv. actinidiae]
MVSPDLPLPFVEAAFHDDNEGLLPITALNEPVKVELKVWNEATEDDVYRLVWNDIPIGESKLILNTDLPGDPLFLEIPVEHLVEGVHSLAFLATNHENNISELSLPVRVEVDLTPPGRPQLGPIKFPPEVEGGLTSDELSELVYRLKINFSHACVVIAARARCILFKISSPLAFQ